MSKELLVQVLTKELGIGKGIASDIANECTPEQLGAVTEYLRNVSRSPAKDRIDSFDKYAVMMMTAFKSASLQQKRDPAYYHVPGVKKAAKASHAVFEASLKDIREFLGG